MNPIRVTGIYCYPVKSCGGISLETTRVGTSGIRFDRQWMIINGLGMFVAQRESRGLGVEVRTLCLIDTALNDEELVLSSRVIPGRDLRVPLTGVEGEAFGVRIWDDSCIGIDQGDEAAMWVTEFVSRERPGQYRLVRIDNRAIRKSKTGTGNLAFADAHPFSVIGESSLYDLNARIGDGTPLPMNRFRPNIVLGETKPYAEDHICEMRIGTVHFTGATLCVRCPITTTDQATVERSKEPLKTLASYRKTADGVVFGRNFNHSGPGIISVGDVVDVTQED